MSAAGGGVRDVDTEPKQDTSVIGAVRDYMNRFLDALSERAESKGLTVPRRRT